jgi:penicillin amidase
MTMRSVGFGTVLLLLACLFPACAGSDEPVVDPGPRLPTAPVEILIDDRGVSHIYAQNDEDLFFAYGYQIASDRLLQLDMFRRFAYGRLSEVLGAFGHGSAGADTLTDDRFARIFNWQHWGKLDAELMKNEEPEHYRLTSAWVAGINKRIAEVNAGEVPPPFGFGPDELDYQPEPWDLVDPYVVQKMAAFGLDQTILYEVFVTFVTKLAPDALAAVNLFQPARKTYTMPTADSPTSSSARSPNQTAGADSRLACLAPPPAISPANQVAFQALGRLNHIKPVGSNNWAVDGRHTESGTPILSGDPHLGYDFSGITYATHLNSMDGGGTFDVTGFGFVGAPGLFAGHNRKVAWTPTSAVADVMDLWAVEIVDGKAKIGGELVATVEREEIIKIRDDEPDVAYVVDVPGYGVIMPSTLVGSPLPIAGGGKEVLVGWTGFKARPARYFRELMRVQSLDEFEQAVLRMNEMTYNFVAADRSGISYRVGVDVPERNPIREGTEPFWTMDANDPESLWTGTMLPPEKLPHTRAEQRGWIVTANNDPFGFTADGLVDNDPYYYGAIFVPGWRAARIEAEVERLISEGKVTPEQMQTLQMDAHSNLADDLIPVIVEAYANVDTDPDLAEFIDRDDLDTLVQLLTVDWDRNMHRDSSGALAFHAFAHLVTTEVMEDDLSPILFELVLTAAPMYLLKIGMLTLTGQYPNGEDVMQEGRDRIVLNGLAATAAFLTERFGGVDPSGYQLSDMKVSSMSHAFGRGVELMTVPTDGGESTVNVSQNTFRKDGVILDQWVSQWGPIERQVMSFNAAGLPQSYANFPLGNVADRSSPHFDDAMTDWTEGDYRKMLYERGEIEAAAEARIDIPPVK